MKTTNKKLQKFLLILVFLFITGSLSAQNCEVRFTEPAAGSRIGGIPLVRGTATIPRSGHLWILAHKAGFNGFFPQGNGAAQLIGNEWEVLVYLGNKGDYGQFEIIALVVSDQTHQELENWVQNAPKTQPPYQPITFPTAVDNCSIARLRLDKTQD
jgi:hypothetical protein